MGPMVLRLRTLVVALAGVAVFSWLGLPLPFLFGPMAALLLAALCRMPLKGVGPVSEGARAILGVAIGADQGGEAEVKRRPVEVHVTDPLLAAAG